MKKSKFGFVLVELILVIGIILILFGFVTLSLIGGNRNVSIGSFVESSISDIKSQQVKAMELVGQDNYGIRLNTNSYILFKGSTYSQSNTTNYAVNLDPDVIITNITFPSSTIVFASKSGELVNYSNGNSSFTIQDTNGIKSTTITFNRYGIVISKN